MDAISSEGIEHLLKQVALIIPRLEKITPDSHWAHQASGCRRAILRAAEGVSREEFELDEVKRLEYTLQAGFRILEAAAVERTGKLIDT